MKPRSTLPLLSSEVSQNLQEIDAAIEVAVSHLGKGCGELNPKADVIAFTKAARRVQDAIEYMRYLNALREATLNVSGKVPNE